MKGKVKLFNDQKGYGFITMEGGNDVFFHYSAVRGEGIKSVSDGEEVECEVGGGPKGLQAVSVKVVQ